MVPHCVYVCVCAVLYQIDILPHSCPVGHSKGRQMAVFRSTTGQHMAPRDKVCVCVCVCVCERERKTENRTLTMHEWRRLNEWAGREKKGNGWGGRREAVKKKL